MAGITHTCPMLKGMVCVWYVYGMCMVCVWYVYGMYLTKACLYTASCIPSLPQRGCMMRDGACKNNNSIQIYY